MDRQEKKRRRRERITICIASLVLILLAVLEVYLLRIGAKLPFTHSIFFFGVMNLNIILILLILFLVFRNAVKLILDERSGKLGSRLKTQLTFSFLLFSLIPSMILFGISALYIKNSFDKWLNVQVGSTLQRSIDVVKTYYQNAEANGLHFSKRVGQIAREHLLRGEKLNSEFLEGLRNEYALDAVEYYQLPLAPRLFVANAEKKELIPPVSMEGIREVFSGQNSCRVHNFGYGELVRCSQFLGSGLGVLFVSYFIPLRLASQLSEISLTYEDFQRDNPLNYPIKSTYFAMLSLMTLLIIFSATWTGFYLARRLTIPLEQLSIGTEQIAQGNLGYQIPLYGGREMRNLISSFNQMTRDLFQNKKKLDATNRHLTQMNSELEDRQRYIQVLLESVPSGVLSLSEQGIVTVVNPAASRLLRLRRSDTIGKHFTSIIPEQHHAEIQKMLYSALESSKPVRKELRIQAPNSEWLTLLVTLSPLRGEDGKTRGVVAVTDDMTEIQKMERMLAWREVAKRIAHEIKNPLTPIQLSVQRIRRRYLEVIKDDGTLDQATNLILKEVDSLKDLVNEFSSFARLPEIVQKPENPSELTLEAINLFRAAHEKIIFEVDFEDGLPLLELDRSQMKRVFINLFDNAVTAMDGRGILSVSLRYDRALGFVIWTVSDQGCGISDYAHSQLFEPYFSTKTQGTGLGLAIVQKIVTDHGGFVRAVPNSPKGTKFVLEFPDRLVVKPKERPFPTRIEEGLLS